MARSIEEESRKVIYLQSTGELRSDIFLDGMSAIAIYLEMKKRGDNVEAVEKTMRSIGLGSFISNA